MNTSNATFQTRGVEMMKMKNTVGQLNVQTNIKRAQQGRKLKVSPFSLVLEFQIYVWSRKNILIV